MIYPLPCLSRRNLGNAGTTIQINFEVMKFVILRFGFLENRQGGEKYPF